MFANNAPRGYSYVVIIVNLSSWIFYSVTFQRSLRFWGTSTKHYQRQWMLYRWSVAKHWLHVRKSAVIPSFFTIFLIVKRVLCFKHLFQSCLSINYIKLIWTKCGINTDVGNEVFIRKRIAVQHLSFHPLCSFLNYIYINELMKA